MWPFVEHEDPPCLLDDVEVAGLAGRRRRVDRRREVRDPHEMQSLSARRSAGDEDGRESDEREWPEPSHRAARSVDDLTQGPGGVSSDSACRYARPASGKSVHRSKQK